ncbi:hypothetical protein Tco_0093311 [Tanacetum coccineum]
MTESQDSSCLMSLHSFAYSSSDEELEELMKDQLLPTDASPIALSSGYISDSDPEEEDEEDQRRILLTILPTEEIMMTRRTKRRRSI